MISLIISILLQMLSISNNDLCIKIVIKSEYSDHITVYYSDSLINYGVIAKKNAFLGYHTVPIRGKSEFDTLIFPLKDIGEIKSLPLAHPDIIDLHASSNSKLISL